MRPLLFLLGLVFVNTLLTANVDAISCYLETDKRDGVKVDCDDPKQFRNGTVSNGQCYTYDGENGQEWGCAFEGKCGGDVTCCSGDNCNERHGPGAGAVTSTSPGPLLIAVIASAIAAFGI